jgi:hypothetical protein
MHGSKAWAGWAELVPPERWNIYRSVIEQANARAIPFALAGAFATATHAGVWRDTNDLDLYTLPENGREMRRLLEGTGLKDIYEQFPYDREWTYRATDGQTIIEVIWRMQNRRADVGPVESGEQQADRTVTIRCSPCRRLAQCRAARPGCARLSLRLAACRAGQDRQGTSVFQRY